MMVLIEQTRRKAVGAHLQRTLETYQAALTAVSAAGAHCSRLVDVVPAVVRASTLQTKCWVYSEYCVRDLCIVSEIYVLCQRFVF